MLLIVCMAGVFPALCLAAVDTDAALNYLATQQNPDGGFGSGFGPDSSVGATADAVLAIVAVEGDPASFDQGGNTPLTYLAEHGSEATLGGDVAKSILAAIAAGENPRTLVEGDPVTRLESMIDESGKIGIEGDTLVGHSLAILALKSAMRPMPTEAVDYLKAAQQENGAWAWDASQETPGDTNTTAYAVQALVAAGEPADDEILNRAQVYYKEVQNDDGGWPYQVPSDFGTDTDANSTAVTIQAVIALGQDPAGEDWTTVKGSTPLSALETLQNPNGAFAWQAAVADDNLLATVQALPAVAGKAFPFALLDVGEPVATTPATMPETGGHGLNLALPLILGGLVLAGGGYALLRKR
jgi:prenyltransferase beta subunit